VSPAFSVLVADDEPLARAMVASLIREDPEVRDVIECDDAVAASRAIAARQIDIAFLDVEMPGMNGLQMAAGLAYEQPVLVFVTAFGQYAAGAFDVHAVDYVLKPFSDNRLIEALGRAKRRVLDRRARGGEAPPEHNATVGARVADEPGFLQRIAIKEGERAVIIKTSDVLWIEAQDYYARVHARTGRHLVRATLLSLEAKLDPRRFLRVHRAAIVNVDEVREVGDRGGMHVMLSNGTRIPVSRARRRRVESVLTPRLRST